MTVTTARTNEAQRGLRVEHGAKRVRAYLGGELVADTTRPLLVWEVPYYPAYYLPVADVRAHLLHPDGAVAHSPRRGDGRTFTVRAGGKEASRAAVRYEESRLEELRDAVRFDWDAMDAWFEEDEQVFTHPRDPYTRVDILASSRHVSSDERSPLGCGWSCGSHASAAGIPVAPHTSTSGLSTGSGSRCRH